MLETAPSAAPSAAQSTATYAAEFIELGNDCDHCIKTNCYVINYRNAKLASNSQLFNLSVSCSDGNDFTTKLFGWLVSGDDIKLKHLITVTVDEREVQTITRSPSPPTVADLDQYMLIAHKARNGFFPPTELSQHFEKFARSVDEPEADGVAPMKIIVCRYGLAISSKALFDRALKEVVDSGPVDRAGAPLTREFDAVKEMVKEKYGALFTALDVSWGTLAQWIMKENRSERDGLLERGIPPSLIHLFEVRREQNGSHPVPTSIRIARDQLDPLFLKAKECEGNLKNFKAQMMTLFGVLESHIAQLIIDLQARNAALTSVAEALDAHPVPNAVSSALEERVEEQIDFEHAEQPPLT